MDFTKEELTEKLKELIHDLEGCGLCRQSLGQLEELMDSSASQITLTLTISRKRKGSKFFEVHTEKAELEF